MGERRGSRLHRKVEKKTKSPLQLHRPGARTRQAGEDGSPDNLPGVETTREKPQGPPRTNRKSEAERPALQRARLGDGPGHKGGKLSPQHYTTGLRTMGVDSPKP